MNQKRRDFIAGVATSTILATASHGTDASAPSRIRLIANQKPEFVQQLTDMEYRLAVMDRYDVDMHLLSITGPGVQAFGTELGCDLAVLTNDKLAAIIKKYPSRYAGLAAA